MGVARFLLMVVGASAAITAGAGAMYSAIHADAAITAGAGAMNSTTGAGAAIKHSGFYRQVLAPNVLIGAGTKETAGAGRAATPPLTLALRTRLVVAPRTRQALRDVL